MRIDLFIHLALPAKGDESLLRAILTQGQHIMATLQQVTDRIAKIAADADAEKAEVAALLQGLKDQIKALQDQIAAGTGVTSADLDGILTALDSVDSKVADISGPTAATTS